MDDRVASGLEHAFPSSEDAPLEMRRSIDFPSLPLTPYEAPPFSLLE